MGVKLSKQVEKLQEEIASLKEQLKKTQYNLHLAEGIKQESLMYSLAKKIDRLKRDISYKEKEISRIKNRISEQAL